MLPIYIPKQNCYPQGLKSQFPLSNHKHETMVITQFFALCPKNRLEKIEHRKVCWTCMKPKDICLGPKCIFYKKVLEVPICPVCKKIADKKDWTAFNIVYCSKGEPKDWQLHLKRLKRLRKNIQKICMQNPRSRYQDKRQIYVSSPQCGKPWGQGLLQNSPEHQHYFWSRSETREGKIIQEKQDDPFYLMQTLRIGSSN